jgi:hypothetical protein
VVEGCEVVAVTWFKVDDKLHDHRKARAAGLPAMGLWVLAGSWSADNTTDGFVPDTVCARWDRQFRKLAAALVRVDLWSPAEKDGEVGWQFHQWEERQPTREEIEKKRAEARERMKNQRKSGTGSPDVRANSDSTFAEVLVPVPSRPVPTSDDGQLGGERYEPLRSVSASKPRPKCTQHPDGNAPGPCASCGKVREYDTKHDAAMKLADAEVAARCLDCHGTGWKEHPNTGLPAGRCKTHRVSA